MELEEKLKNFSVRVNNIKGSINTEEATKTSIIMPFFQILGYDVFNPNEFVPEYIADVGIKKGEKVDYAIILNSKISILIEAKSINENLNKHDSQLFRYYGTSPAKFAILTNGINYKFYTDLEKDNVMDINPFLEINLLDLKENDINELRKFEKVNFNMELILTTASDLKFSNQIQNVIKEEFSNPSDNFVKMILSMGIYDGIKTQTVIDKYKPILKKALNTYVNKLINNKIQSAMKDDEEQDEYVEEQESKIITTTEELESFYVIKSILSECCDSTKINYKDTESYFSVIYDNKVTKWICRVYLKENVRYITILSNDKKEIRYDINEIGDIYKYKKEIKSRYNNIINNKVKEELEILV